MEQALYRELEEIGLQSKHVTLLGSTSDWILYKLPKSVTCVAGVAPPASARNNAGSCCAWRCPTMRPSSISRRRTSPSSTAGDRRYWEPVR